MEKDTLSKIKDYLLDLGYTQLQIRSDIKTTQGELVDFIVYFKDKPWIVVEVKKNFDFNEQNYNELRFNPYIRKLQLNAKHFSSPYYLLTNGNSFLWFQTDSSGRPEALKSPVCAPPSSEKELPPNKEFITKLFRHLKDILSFGKISADNNLDAAILILYRLLNKKNISSHDNIRQIEDIFYHNDLSLLLNLPQEFIFRLDKDILRESLELLYYISFEEISPKEIISALDTVFLKTKKHEFPIKRWLADFMVQLSNLKTDSIVLDLNSGMGEILAAISLIENDVNSSFQTYGICQTLENYVWAKIQQLILGNSISNIYTGKFIDVKNEYYKQSRPTNIIAAVPFGTVYNNELIYRSAFGLNKIEDIYLENAIECLQPQGRIVALVPDSFLFSEGRRKQFRNYILNTMQLKAIISLPIGAFLPYSSVKSDIIVLDKKTNSNPKNCFIAQVKDQNIKDSFDSRENLEMDKILNGFNLYDNDNEMQNNVPYYWIISRAIINPANLTVANYIPLEIFGEEALIYPMVTLKEVANIVKRGKNIRLDEQGNVSVIGPAAIRPLEVNINNLGKTSINKTDYDLINVEVGDIIMNNIGNYLGASVVVDNDIKGLPISQHIILIKPNTSIILSEYLALILNSDFVKPQISQKATGAVMPAISISNLFDVKIPLPNIEIQTKISERINKRLEEIKILREKLKKSEEELSNLIAKVFVEGGEE